MAFISIGYSLLDDKLQFQSLIHSGIHNGSEECFDSQALGELFNSGREIPLPLLHIR